MIQLTSEQFEAIRIALVQIASIGGSEGYVEIESLAEIALANLQHSALDSHQPEMLGLSDTPEHTDRGR